MEGKFGDSLNKGSPLIKNWPLLSDLMHDDTGIIEQNSEPT